jgi:transposase
MKGSRFSEEQIIRVLREQEAGASTEEVCRRHGISSATFYKWKANPPSGRIGRSAFAHARPSHCVLQSRARRIPFDIGGLFRVPIRIHARMMVPGWRLRAVNR